MKKTLIIWFLISCIVSPAQDSTNTRQGDIYSKWPAWRMDGKILKAKELKQEIYEVPAAIPYYKKAQTNYTLSLVAIAATNAFLLLGRQNNNIGSSNFGKQKTGFLIAGLLSSGVGIHLIFRSLLNMKTAVRLRNKHQVMVY